MTETTFDLVPAEYKNGMIATYASFGWEVSEISLIKKIPDDFTPEPRLYASISFIRSLDLPHLDEIKQLEREYRNIEKEKFRYVPEPQKWGDTKTGIKLLFFFIVPGLAYFLIRYLMNRDFDEKMEAHKKSQEALSERGERMKKVQDKAKALLADSEA